MVAEEIGEMLCTRFDDPRRSLGSLGVMLGVHVLLGYADHSGLPLCAIQS
jgi:hypothetical protein